MGLYGDQVPTIALNDENGLATAILRMVNNQGDPVLVLKEYGKDRLIIDKNGSRESSGTSDMTLLLIGIISGAFG